MQRGRYISLGVLAGAVMLAAGAAKPVHAQGQLQALPRAGGAVFVSWTASADPAVVGYNLYRRETSLTADKSTRINADQPVAATTFLDEGQAVGKAVIYYVRPVFKDAAGKLLEGSSSAEAVVTPQNALKLPPGDFLLYDLDTLNAGTAAVDGNVLTIRGSGPDLWDRQDGQAFLGMPVAGDYQITAQLMEKPENQIPDEGNGWAKVGVQIRSGPYLGAPFACLFVSPDRADGLLYEGRKVFHSLGVGDGDLFSQPPTESIPSTDMQYPLYLRLVKQGATITSFQSLDGTSFTQVGDPQNFAGALGDVTYAGISATASRDGQYVIGKFAVDTIKIEPK